MGKITTEMLPTDSTAVFTNRLMKTGLAVLALWVFAFRLSPSLPSLKVGLDWGESGEGKKPAKSSMSLADMFAFGDDEQGCTTPELVSKYEADVKDYVEKFSKVAKAEMYKFGIPASISLAQGLVESRAGTSKLARGNNNHFGMKCFSKKCPTGHCTNATDDHHKDFFRKYHSAWESWREHSQLLAGEHYARLKKFGNDYRQWAYGLKALGYATDRTYAEKLIGMIERYDLKRFDN